MKIGDKCPAHIDPDEAAKKLLEAKDMDKHMADLVQAGGVCTT